MLYAVTGFLLHNLPSPPAILWPMVPRSTHEELADFDRIGQRMAALRAQLQRVVVGQEATVEALLVALLCRGHVLVVGVPGLAKTMLVRTLARATGLAFRRIQFTPDMMPSDVLGTELIQEDPHTGQRSLRFARGPVFTQLLLADEINRTPPRTQSALLEAMAEGQVTVAGRTQHLDEPFIVVATQNPIEQEGTYPLPEAQLDRFLFSLWMDYPDRAEERRIVAETPRIHAEAIEPALTREELLRYADLVWRMPVSPHVVDYAVAVARATRPTDPDAAPMAKQMVEWGAGPRAGQAMVHAAKALAAMEGLPAPGADHVRRVAMAALRHRIVMNYAAAADGIDSVAAVRDVLDHVREADYR